MKACSYSTRYKGKRRPKCLGNTFAPCDSCLAKYFRKGRRVVLGGEWKQWRWEVKTPPIGQKAKVVGLSRTQGCIRIVFDGQKTPQSWHCSFLERVHGTKRKSKGPTAKT
jgi:hypothetical protein